MKKHIVLFSGIFLLLNSAASTGREFVVIDAEKDHISPCGISNRIQYMLREEKPLPDNVSETLFGRKHHLGYIFDISEGKSEDYISSEVSVSGTTGVIKHSGGFSLESSLNAFGYMDQTHHYLTMVFTYNTNARHEIDESIYYLASFETVAKTHSNPWEMDLSHKEVAQGLFRARAELYIEETIVNILDDGPKNSTPNVLQERMEKLVVRKFRLEGKNAEKIMKEELDSKGPPVRVMFKNN